MTYMPICFNHVAVFARPVHAAAAMSTGYSFTPRALILPIHEATKG